MKLNWAQDSDHFGRSFAIQGAFPRRGYTCTYRKLLLTTPYVTGGWTLDRGDTLLKACFGGFLLIDNDPSKGIPIPAPGVQPVLVVNEWGSVTLKLFINGAEATAGWTGAANAHLWLAFTGSR